MTSCLLALLIASNGNWRPSELRVSDRPPLEDFPSLQRIALQYLGRPYVYGGTGRPGYDCSGFTCRVFAEAGYAIPRVSRDQARSGVEVDKAEIRPGDLLFFAENGGPVSHVGLYLGRDQMVHASSGQGEVVIASLEQGWFQRHWVGARRILDAPPESLLSDGEVSELVEHGRRNPLALPLQVPPDAPPPRLGPQWYVEEPTQISVSGGVVTEAGRASPILVPEAVLHVRAWGLSLGAGVPLRLDPNGEGVLGPVADAREALRFLRNLRLGRPGARFELGVERQRVYSVGGLVRDFAPFSDFDGIPGRSIRPSPLSGALGLRLEHFEVEALVDDVTRPDVMAASAALSLGRWRLLSSYSLEEDDGTHHLRTSGTWRFVQRKSFGLSFELASGLQTNGRLTGVGGQARLDIRKAFGARLDDRLRAYLDFGVASRNRVIDPLGPTQPVGRDALVEAAAASVLRPWLGAGLELHTGPVEFGALYAQGLRASGENEDRRLELGLAILGLPIGGRRSLSLRAAFRARRPFRDPIYVAWASAQLQLAPWLGLEAYAQRGPSWEGGLALRAFWAP